MGRRKVAAEGFRGVVPSLQRVGCVLQRMSLAGYSEAAQWPLSEWAPRWVLRGGLAAPIGCMSRLGLDDASPLLPPIDNRPLQRDQVAA